MNTRPDGALQRRNITDSLAGLLIGLGLLAVAAMAVYLTVRVVLVVEGGYRGVEVPVTLALLLAEGFILAHAAGYMLSIVRALRRRPPLQAAVLNGDCDWPHVDVLVAARHEPRRILHQTLTSLVGLTYPNKTIWLLDDSSDPRFVAEATELAREFGVRLFRRDKRHGAKAGIINDCLAQLQGRYVAIFDADQNPMPFFLNRIVPLLEADDGMAFVQTPQFYANITENRVARAAGAQQAVFYEFICEAKGAGGAAFCCGTNVVFRREALQRVGGLDESSVTEDFATSVRLHAAGWRSAYYGQAYTMGSGPESLTAYFRQQFRWARGTLGVGLRLLGMLLTRPRSLGFWQWVDYLLSGTFYLVGWAYLVLMICPMLYIFLGIPSYLVRPEIYTAAFLPYLLFAVGAFLGGLRQRHYTLWQILQGQLLVVLAAPVHIVASLSALTGRASVFGITPKDTSGFVPLRALWPQVGLCVLNYAALIWGVSKCVFEHDLAAGINAFWAGAHFAILWSVFYFREAEPRPVRIPGESTPRLEVALT